MDGPITQDSDSSMDEPTATKPIPIPPLPIYQHADIAKQDNDKASDEEKCEREDQMEEEVEVKKEPDWEEYNQATILNSLEQITSFYPGIPAGSSHAGTGDEQESESMLNTVQQNGMYKLEQINEPPAYVFNGENPSGSNHIVTGSEQVPKSESESPLNPMRLNIKRTKYAIFKSSSTSMANNNQEEDKEQSEAKRRRVEPPAAAAAAAAADETEDDRPHKCMICVKGFKRNPDLTRHMKLHRRKRPSSGSAGHDIIKKASSYIANQMSNGNSNSSVSNSETGDGNMEDNNGNDGEPESEYLPYEPPLKRNGNGKFECEECGNEFTRGSSLRVHKRLHGDGEKPYKCKECDFACFYKSYLTVHMRVHTNEKPYSCEECQLSFAHSNRLKTHMIKIHMIKHICDQCDYTCSDNVALKIHKRVHSGENIYTCDECDYSCPKSNSLKIHKQKHSVDRPFKCEVCNKGFKRKSDVTRHMRVHTKGTASAETSLLETPSVETSLLEAPSAETSLLEAASAETSSSESQSVGSPSVLTQN